MSASASLNISLAQVTRATLTKDLRLEWRSKDATNAMLFFALLVVVIFSFAFDPNAEEARQIAGGLVWMAFLFSSSMALNQSWARELQHHVLDGFRASPAPPNALFLGKAIGNFIFVALLELIVAPLFLVFFNLRIVGSATQFVIVMLLGTWAIVGNGAFFAAMSLRTRNRELMLPLLLFPITIPALIVMVQATTGTLSGAGDAGFGIRFLAVYNIVFTTVALLLFEKVLNAE